MVALQACLPTESQRPVPIEVLGQGNQCGAAERGARWIDVDALERLAVDADKAHHLLLVSQGEQPSGGYGVTVQQVRRERDSVLVHLNLHEPEEDELVTDVVTRPCVLLGVPAGAARVELRDVNDEPLAELDIPDTQGE